jgi:hypothetical protein
LAAGIKKALSSGKLGEAGAKMLVDGSFICPSDNLNDNLKMLDEVINTNGLKDQIKIGLEFQGYEMYRPDAKKYEYENPNPKNFLDSQQMVI